MVIQRFVDAWQSFPGLVILIVAVAVLGPGMPQVIGVLALLFGIAGSRIVRGAVVSVREHMYIHAAQSITRWPRSVGKNPAERFAIQSVLPCSVKSNIAILSPRWDRMPPPAAPAW